VQVGNRSQAHRAIILCHRENPWSAWTSAAGI
jgi:hypothetical protein